MTDTTEDLFSVDSDCFVPHGSWMRLTFIKKILFLAVLKKTEDLSFSVETSSNSFICGYIPNMCCARI